MLEKTEKMITDSVESMKELAIGGTAVGTGLTRQLDSVTVLRLKLVMQLVLNSRLHKINSIHLRAMMKLFTFMVQLKHLRQTL